MESKLNAHVIFKNDKDLCDFDTRKCNKLL